MRRRRRRRQQRRFSGSLLRLLPLPSLLLLLTVALGGGGGFSKSGFGKGDIGGGFGIFGCGGISCFAAAQPVDPGAKCEGGGVVSLTVEDADGVAALRETLAAEACLAAKIQVTWVGRVPVAEAIELPNSSGAAVELTITGEAAAGGAAAEVAGIGADRLFVFWGGIRDADGIGVDNEKCTATLQLVGVILSGGSGAAAVAAGAISRYYGDTEEGMGGAVVIDRGSLFARDVEFRASAATGDRGGGAVFVRGPLSSFDLELALQADAADGAEPEPGVVFRDCRFFDQSSQKNGGAVYLYDTVAVFDDVYFKNNTAVDSNGGGILVHGGRATLSGVDFVENTASNAGGIHVESGDNFQDGHAPIGTALLDDCLFEANSATNTDGGALRVDYNGSAIVTSSNFFNNSAAGEGGAIYLNYFASLSITDSQVRGNSAATTGGGIHAQVLIPFNCTRSTFAENHANENGGGVYAFERVWMRWVECNVTDNVADLNGGGVFVTSSSELNMTDSTVARNSVRVGGASIVVAGSSVVRARSGAISGDTAAPDALQMALQTGAGTTFTAYGVSFEAWTGLYAVFYAGAGLVLDACDFSGSSTGSYIIYSGEAATSCPPAVVRNAVLGDGTWGRVGYAANASFSDNALTCDGGASAGYVGYSGGGGLCADGGDCYDAALGALCLCYVSALTPDGGDLTQITAYETSETTVVCLTGEADVALTADAADSGAGIKSPPATTAVVTAGAAAGASGVLFSLSVSPTAWSAVPARGIVLAGSAVQAQLSAPVSAIIDGVTEVTVVGGFQTQEDFRGASADVAFTFEHCPANYFYDDSGDAAAGGGTCVDCVAMRGVECSQPGNVLTALTLDPGYWRSNPTTLDIEACLGGTTACPGGSATDPDGYCASGYEGPLCGVCADSHARGLYDTCHECNDKYTGAMYFTLALLCLMAIVAFVALARFLVVPPNPSDGSRSGAATGVNKWQQRLRRVPWNKLRIPIVCYQIVTLFAAVTSAELPTAYAKFLAGLSIVNIDIGFLVSAGCLAPSFDFYDRLLIMTLLPLGVLLVLAVTFRVGVQVCHNRAEAIAVAAAEASQRKARRRSDASGHGGGSNHHSSGDGGSAAPETPAVNGGGGGDHLAAARPAPAVSAKAAEAAKTQAIKVVAARHKLAILVVTFILYSSVSTVIFQTFKCVSTGDGEFLRADLTLSCRTPTYHAYAVYASVMILVYPVGIPLVYLWLLVRHKTRIMKTSALLPDGRFSFVRRSMRRAARSFRSGSRRTGRTGGSMHSAGTAGSTRAAVAAATNAAASARDIAAEADVDGAAAGGGGTGTGSGATGDAGADGGFSMRKKGSMRPSGSVRFAEAAEPAGGNGGCFSATTMAANRAASAGRDAADAASSAAAAACAAESGERGAAASAASDGMAAPRAPLLSETKEAGGGADDDDGDDDDAPDSPPPQRFADAVAGKGIGFGAVAGAGGASLAAEKEQRNAAVEERLRPHAASFLALAYRPRRYYFEPIECLRRLLLTGALVFILPDSPLQAAVACVLCVGFLAVFALLQPLRDSEDAAAYVIGSLVIFLTMLDSLVIKAGQADKESGKQVGVAVVLIAMNVLLAALVTAQMVVVTAQFKESNATRDTVFYEQLLSMHGEGDDGMGKSWRFGPALASERGVAGGAFSVRGASGGGAAAGGGGAGAGAAGGSSAPMWTIETSGTVEPPAARASLPAGEENSPV